MKCPACKTSLAMSERQGIEIDYCPKCCGVWLDRGELDKIVECATAELATASRAASPPSGPSGAEYGDGRHQPQRDDHHRGGRHRKSFWKEPFH
jgi:uncharacterized protein